MPEKTPKRRRKRRRRAPEDAEILNAEGAAKALGVSPRLVLRLAREGKLPGKKVGKEWRFRRSAILRWLGDTEPPPPDWLQKLINSGKAKESPPKSQKESRTTPDSSQQGS